MPSDAEILTCTNDEYHADTSSLSNSGAKLLSEDPALFFGRYISKQWPFQATEAMDFGTTFHDLILQPGGLERVVRIPPHVMGKGNRRAGKAWKTFQAEHPGCTLWYPRGKPKLTNDEKAGWMCESLKADERACWILGTNTAEHEVAIRWTCLDTGVRRRAKLDLVMWYIPNEGGTARLIADVKTTSGECTEQGLSSTIYRYGYHRQASWYIDAADALYGKRLQFVFIFVKTSAPFTVACVDLDDDYLQLGREENEIALLRYKQCLETGVWRRPTHGQIVRLAPPGWAKYQSQWVA